MSNLAVGFQIAMHIGLIVKLTDVCPTRWLSALVSTRANRPAVA
jgi:hypothetical protein